MNPRDVPIWLVAGITVFGGIWFLSWHQFANDDADESWLDPGQPPQMVALPLAPGVHGTSSPMSCNVGFRSRCYPDLLATAKEAIREVLN